MVGTASLTLINREEPFETSLNADHQFDDEKNIGFDNLIYDFKPPNKQFDNDINSRSGGEKTIAGLALIFALA